MTADTHPIPPERPTRRAVGRALLSTTAAAGISPFGAASAFSSEVRQHRASSGGAASSGPPADGPSKAAVPSEGPVAGRNLDFKVGQGFSGASVKDIVAVLHSAGTEIWKHCPNTLWKVPGFFIFRSPDHPVTRFDHTADGRIAIGLTTQGTYWSQFAFQFSHEFCHALAGHSNDWRTTWIRGRKANHWLEESICEVASLFAMRSMAKTWEIAPPYPNWKSYAPALAQYAGDRLRAVETERGNDFSFRRWFAGHEAKMRASATRREWNNIVASELLPIFEDDPSGWESLAGFNRGEIRDPERSLAEHFRDWSEAVPKSQRSFVARIGVIFGVWLTV